jgi:hypothetical protein
MKIEGKNSTNDTQKLTVNYHNIWTFVKAYTKLYHHIKLRSITNEIDIKSSPEDVLSHWIYGSPYLPYYGSSSGYLMLLNAFTRRKKVINTSTF